MEAIREVVGNEAAAAAAAASAAAAAAAANGSRYPPHPMLVDQGWHRFSQSQILW